MLDLCKFVANCEKQLPLTAGHTQLPCRAGANVGSLGYLVVTPTSKRSETATAYTGER